MAIQNRSTEATTGVDIPAACDVAFPKLPDFVASVDLQSMPTTSLVAIFEYGLNRILNDAGAGAETATERKAAIEKRLTALESGDYTGGGAGGTRRNPVEVEYCGIIANMLRGRGIKAVEATKRTKSASMADTELRNIIRIAMAKKLNKSPSEILDADLAEAFDSNRATKWQAAEKAIAEKAEASEIEV